MRIKPFIRNRQCILKETKVLRLQTDGMLAGERPSAKTVAVSLNIFMTKRGQEWEM